VGKAAHPAAVRGQGGSCSDASKYEHFFHEFQSSDVLRSLKGGSLELSENLPWSSDLFDMEIPVSSLCYGVHSPAFLTRRIYGKVVHSPCDLSDPQYLMQRKYDGWVHNKQSKKLSPTSGGLAGNHNLGMLASSMLRLERFVGANGMQFHDTQFIVSSSAIQLFDTMIALCDGPKCLCESAPVTENDPCLSTTYLRAYLLQTSLWLMLEKVYIAQSSEDDVADDYIAMAAEQNADWGKKSKGADINALLGRRKSWKMRLIIEQRAKSRSCNHKLRAILTGVPSVIPQEVIDAIEMDSDGRELLGRIRALSDQFPSPATNGAGLVCFDDLPEPNCEEHNKCALGINQSGWDSAQARLSTQGQALLAKFRQIYPGNCGYMKYLSYQK
jgi:hypothetical protein